MARTASRLFSRGLGSSPVGTSFTTWLTRPIPTSATSARMIGIFERWNPSAICSGMLAPATSSTTATKRKNFRYRNSPRITAQPSTAISVACETPSPSSTYSWGRLASTAVTVISPISTSSRIRIRVRKSSRSAFSPGMLPPFSRILKAWRGAGKRRIRKIHVEGLCQGRKRPAGGGTRDASASGGQELHYARRLRTPEGRAQTAGGGRAPRSGEDGGLGGLARRSIRERRLSLRQAAPARNRPPHPLSHQAAGGGGGGECEGARHRPGVLRCHREAKNEERRNRDLHRWRRRGG